MTLQNYVLEQEINNTSIGDIYVEQAIAEFEVACAVLECYQKEEILLEYASSDISEFGIFQEGAWDKVKETGGKAKEGLKKAGHAVKTALKKGWEMVLRAVENFMNIFRKVNFTKMAEKFNQYPADTTWKINLRPFSMLQDTFTYAEKLAEKMADGETDAKVFKSMNERYHQCISALIDDDGTEQTATMSVLTKELMAVGSQGQHFGVGFHNLKKSVDFDTYVENNDVPKETINEITKMMKSMTTVYMEASKTIKSLLDMYGKQGDRHVKDINDTVKENEKKATKQKNNYKKDHTDFPGDKSREEVMKDWEDEE